MRTVLSALCLVVVTGLFIAGHLAAGQDTARNNTVVIYPGDYVVQTDDLTTDGRWRKEVNPSAVRINPGDVVYQAQDMSLLSRMLVDVNPATGTVELNPQYSKLDNPDKAIVSDYINVTYVDCIDCTGLPIATRTIRISGSYNSSPDNFVWTNPAIGWPSTPASSGNVQTVSSGTFTPGPPYNNNDPFSVDFEVGLAPLAPFSVWVDIVGDLN